MTATTNQRALTTKERGIQTIIKETGAACLYTQDREPQYLKIMDYLYENNFKYDVVNYKDEIYSNRLPVEGNEDIWQLAQHRLDLADLTRVHDLEEKFKAGEGQKQIPLFLEMLSGGNVPFCGIRRDRACASLVEQGEECVDDFLAIQVHPEYLDGTLVSEEDFKVHLTWLAGFSNSDQEDIKDPLSMEEKAVTLANIVKAEGLDYSEESHVEQMHNYLKKLHPKDFGGEHSSVRGLRTKCIRTASESITTKMSEESVTGAEQMLSAFFPDEVWDADKTDQRTVQMELGTSGSRYFWFALDPDKKHSILHDCQAKDAEIYMKFHKKQTEETYNKHIKEVLKDYTEWNNVNMYHLTCHVAVTRLMMPKSNLGSWDRDRAWVWKPNHKDGAQFVEVFKV